ncbi:D-aminoacylase [Candidatus Thorarchaeota archaeon]|nr:MAG: D-aminoacylase [Candidatus Thorarchaeota archaeon]
MERGIMDYDIIIKNGRIIDGTGNPWMKSDVGISNGKISSVGELDTSRAEHVIDASGLIVAPGFIDIHTHSDLTLLINSNAESKVRQGVTTEVLGNCGTSPAPVNDSNLDLLKKTWGFEADEVDWGWKTFGDYLRKLEDQGTAVNVIGLVGHGTVRIAVMGVDNRTPSSQELAEMKELVTSSMAEGAFGMSSGLVYLPGSFATTDELVELCKVVAQHGGLYTSHIRGERETIVDALKETIEIAERSGVRLQVSHNCPKYGAHGKFEEMSQLYDDARKRGADLTIDNDAHTDFNPQLSQVLPQWAQAGGYQAAAARLRDPEMRKRIKRETLDDKLPGPGYAGLVKHGRWDRIFLLHAVKNKSLIGKSFEEIAVLRGKDPIDAYFDLLVEEDGNASALFNYIDEEDIKALLRHPLMMVCSDGNAVAPYGTLSKIQGYWPCSYGEYPYILERYVREEGILTLQEAIRKMTSFPAQKLGLRDRGLIREGMWADIVIFNFESIRDRATCRFPYSFPLPNYPHRYPEGIEHVIVNGQVVVTKGEHTGALAGRVLRRSTRISI